MPTLAILGVWRFPTFLTPTFPPHPPATKAPWRISVFFRNSKKNCWLQMNSKKCPFPVEFLQDIEGPELPLRQTQSVCDDGADTSTSVTGEAAAGSEVWVLEDAVAEFLEKSRRVLLWSQSEIAAALHTTRPTLLRYEHAVAQASLENQAHAFSQALSHARYLLDNDMAEPFFFLHSVHYDETLMNCRVSYGS